MEDIVSYEPDGIIKKSLLSTFVEIARDIYGSRWLIYYIVKRDFFALYRQSLMGMLWAVIVPSVSIVTFSILSNSGIFSAGQMKIPYPVYVLTGLMFWQLFSTGLIACTNSIVGASHMISRINFPKKSLIIASIGQPLITFAIQLWMLCILLLYYRIVPSFMIILMPLLIIPLVMLTIGLGFILSLLNSMVRDISNIISIMSVFLMFITPVMYVKPTHGLLFELTQFNPLYYLISPARELMLTGQLSDMAGMLVSIVLSLMIFVVGLIFFHVTETRIAERV